MYNLELLIALLAVVIALAEVADRIKLPYPILLVFVGITLGSSQQLKKICCPPSGEHQKVWGSQD